MTVCAPTALLSVSQLLRLSTLSLSGNLSKSPTKFWFLIRKKLFFKKKWVFFWKSDKTKLGEILADKKPNPQLPALQIPQGFVCYGTLLIRSVKLFPEIPFIWNFAFFQPAYLQHFKMLDLCQKVPRSGSFWWIWVDYICKSDRDPAKLTGIWPA